MFNTTFFWVFVAFYLLYETVHFVLEFLNYQAVKKNSEVPEIFYGRITQSIFERSKAYTLEKIQFSATAHLGRAAFFWILIFRNGLNVFDYYAAWHGGYGTLTHSVLFCIFVAMYFGLVGLPFRLYSTFVIEQKYGFNQMSFGLFIIDFFKALILSAAIGIPLLYVVFWFMKTSGGNWWLWVWGALTLFQLFVAAIYPSFLAPIFNKFRPLPAGELKERITELAKKIHFAMSGIFVMDGSRRSTHSNAYFAGMGKFRRIVLFDTLIKQLTEDELLGVLAHEMGHNVKKHIRNSMVLSSAMSLAGFFILSKIIDWPEFYQAFNLMEPSNHTALVIFMLVSEVFTFVLTPLFNCLSRYNEYQADRFAVENTGNKEAMKSALIKLTKDNLSNLTPHKAYSFFHYSHPTTAERTKAIDDLNVKV